MLAMDIMPSRLSLKSSDSIIDLNNSDACVGGLSDGLPCDPQDTSSCTGGSCSALPRCIYDPTEFVELPSCNSTTANYGFDLNADGDTQGVIVQDRDVESGRGTPLAAMESGGTDPLRDYRSDPLVASTAAGRCVHARPASCTSTTDCPDGSYCDATFATGVCVLRSPASCLTGEYVNAPLGASAQCEQADPDTVDNCEFVANANRADPTVTVRRGARGHAGVAIR